MRENVKRHIWWYVGGVLTALTAMIIFQLILPLFQRDAELRAEIRPSQFVVPLDLVEDHAKTTARDILEVAIDRYELTDKARTDLQDAINDFAEIEPLYWDLTGIVFIEITNDGHVPAKDVKLTIEGLLYYSSDTRGGRGVTDADTDVIKIPEVSQDQTISIVAWTSEGHSYNRWFSARDQFGLTYEHGRGDVSIYLHVRPVFSFLDNNIEYIIWSLLMFIVIIYWTATSASRRTSQPEPAEEQTTEEAHEQKD